jgi:flagellar hook-length control protein FliK
MVTTNGPHTETLPSQTTVDPNLVVDQILRGAFLNTVGSVSTVRMRLVPEELGDISVKLTIEGSSVSAQVMAQTSAAHDALVAGQGQLTRALADAGLKLTSFNVDVAGGFASFQQQQQQDSSQQGTSNGRAFLGGVDTPESDDATLVAAPNFGPPVLAGTSWSALNYLV